MDDRRFDDLVMRLAHARLSRLAALRGVAAGALTGLAGVALPAAEGAATRRRKGKGKGNGKKGRAAKVTLCHKPGTPDEATITVADAAVPAHLAHGDAIGPCAATTTTTPPEPTTTTTADVTTSTTPDPFICTGVSYLCGDVASRCGVNKLCLCLKTADEQDLCSSQAKCSAGNCSTGEAFCTDGFVCVKGMGNCCPTDWGCAAPVCIDTF